MALGDKSFKELTIPELKEVARQFAVDLDGKTKKADILTELGEMGVTWLMYEETLEPEIEEEEIALIPEDFTGTVEEEVVVEEEEDEYVVVKMIRTNFSYEIRGYKFNRQHPYALVKEEDADYLVEVDGGFRVATPRELREFYAG